jgi:peptidoglycan/LPS O-acetylase OafA/YrhL
MSRESPAIDTPGPAAVSPGPTLPKAFRPAFGHVAELDGVRGLAIAMVFAFHYVGFQGQGTLSSYLSGATRSLWSGVDLFFVLSGFLITGILVDARGRPGYFTRFYARRSLRIFPLYFGLLAVTFLVLPAIVPMTSVADRRLLAHQAWLWTYTTNFKTMVSGNAAFMGDHIWLHHLWSLAVEEHYYLIWPFLVGLAPLRLVRRVCWVCLAVCPVVRIGLMETSLPPIAAYAATFCRLDSLTIGSLLALLVRGEAGELSACGVMRGAWLSALAVLGFFLWRGELHPEDPWVRTVGYSLLGFSAAGFILAAVSWREDGLLRQALRLRPLRELGKYSYGLYVYHVALQPSLDFLSTKSLQKTVVRSFALAGITHLIASLVVCAGVAVLSWHLFEKPFLSWKRRFE